MTGWLATALHTDSYLPACSRCFSSIKMALSRVRFVCRPVSNSVFKSQRTIVNPCVASRAASTISDSEPWNPPFSICR